tara:strand:- start:1032 stop:2069 length:1038 start_codon:yes stop_codon:yes gene_type:complete
MIKKSLILASVSGLGMLTAYVINIPLPFFLGPFFSVMMLSFLGFKFEIPDFIWSGTRLITGVYLASKLSPELAGDIVRWSGSFLVQFILITLTLVIISFYYRKYCGFDLPTSVSSSTPGGATTVFLISQDFGTINIHQHFIIHLSRMFFIVSVIPFTIQYYLANETISVTQINNFDFEEASIVLSSALVLAFIAKRLKVPSPFFVGPVIGIGTLYITGLTQIHFPDFGLNSCLFIIGIYIGLRFQNYELKQFLSNLRFSFVSIILTFGLTVIFSFLSHLIFDLDLLALFLSYTPGGIYEMTGIAMALDYEPDFVVAHHLVRLFTLIIIMPFIFRYIFRLNLRNQA